MSEVETYKREALKSILNSTNNFEFPIISPSIPQREVLSTLLNLIYTIGMELEKLYPHNIISLILRGSYACGHPHTAGDDVDLLFIGDNLTQEIENEVTTLAAERLQQYGFKLCKGKKYKGIDLQPKRFLDLSRIYEIVNGYLFGLKEFVNYCNEKDDSFLKYVPIKAKKLAFLKSGILIPFLLWVYGEWNRQIVFAKISELLPVPTKPLQLYGPESIDEAKETLRQAYIARWLTGNPFQLLQLIEYQIPEITKGDIGSSVHNEAEQLFTALRPLEKIYTEAIKKYIILAKLEQDILGRRVTPERIRLFAPSYDNMVLRRVDQNLISTKGKVPISLS